MDLEQEETITTDHDSDEADESFYLRRLMLTGEQPLSSPTIINTDVLNDEISPQIARLCSRGQKQNTLLTEQLTDGTVAASKSPVRVEQLKTSSGLLKASKTMKRVTQNEADTTATRMSKKKRVNSQLDITSKPQSSTSTSSQTLPQNMLHEKEPSLDKNHPQSAPVLRRSLRTIIKTLKQKNNGAHERSVPEVTMKKKGKTTKDSISNVSISPSPTLAKEKLRFKPYISPGFRGIGIKNPQTGRVLSVNSINRRNQFGETKLHKAVMQGDIRAVKNMIKVGASVNLRDNAGWTPLHEAVERNNYNMAEVLLTAGAQVNCRGYNGITPLHDAVQHRYYKIINLLLKYGADSLLKCDRGRTPLDMIPDENPPSSTDAPVNERTRQGMGQNFVSGTRAVRQQKLEEAATSSEHENNLQSSEAEPLPGPSRGKSNCDSPVKFEAPFKGEAGETERMKGAKSVAEELSEVSFHDYISDHPSLSGDSCNVLSAKALPAGKRGLDSCKDNYGADIKDDINSATAEKKIKRTKHNSQKEKDFLEYLLNFDLNRVSVVNGESNRDLYGPSLELNEDASKDQQLPLAVYQRCPSQPLYISDTHNGNSQECSVSLLAPRLNELSDSNLQGTLKSDVNIHLSEVLAESALRKEELCDSSSTGSPSLLMGVIHNEGLTCSPELSEEDEPLEELDTANKQPTAAEAIEKEPFMALQFHPEVQIQQEPLILKDTISGGSEPDVNTPYNPKNDLTRTSLQELISPNIISLLNPLKQDEKTDMSTMQNQQGVIEIPLDTSPTQLSWSQSDNNFIVCNMLICDALILNSETKTINMEPNSSNKGTEFSEGQSEHMTQEDHPFNINDDKGLANMCAKLDVTSAENYKDSADSDCTVVEQLYQSEATDKQDDLTTIQCNVDSSGEKLKEKESENTNNSPDKTGSLSVFLQTQWHDHALPPLDDIQDPNLALENKEMSTSYQKKKVKHRTLQKKSCRPNKAQNTAASKQDLKISKKGLNKRNGLGETFLHRACMKGDLQLVKGLVEDGISVNISDNAGWTALHEASAGGFVDVVEQLLEAGADVTSRGLDGRTPLHDAVISDRYEVVRLLLQFGSNSHDKNALGQSAVDLAKHESIKELLLTFKGPFRKPGQTTDTSKQGSQLLAEEQMQPAQPVNSVVRPKRVVRGRPKCVKKSCMDTSSLKMKPGRSRIIKTMLKDMEQKQKEMATWELKDATDNDRFNKALSEVQTVLNDMLLKQQEVTNVMTKQYRIASDSFSEGILKDCLADLASCQKHLLTVLKKQTELKHKVEMSRDCSLTQSHSLSPSDQCLQQSTGTGIDSSGNRKLICLIRDGVIQYGDDNLEITLKGSRHKASLLQNGSIRDANGKVFLCPEHWVESLLGNNIPVTSDFAWKKVMYQSRSLWDCTLSTYSEEPVQQQCCSFIVSAAGPALKESVRKNVFMNIKTIHLISDEEFYPSYLMNRYWDLFTQSEEWILET